MQTTENRGAPTYRRAGTKRVAVPDREQTFKHMFFWEDSGVEPFFLGGADSPEVTVRIYPGLCPDGFDVWRLNDQEYGNWLQFYSAVKFFGQEPNRFSFVLGDSDTDNFTHEPVTAMWDAFYKVMKVPRLAAQKPAHWQDFFQANKRGGPSEIMMMQGEIWQIGDKVFGPPLGREKDKPTRAIILTKTAIDAVMKLCSLRSPGGGYQIGDPVSLDKGVFFTFYKPDDYTWSARVTPTFGGKASPNLHKLSNTISAKVKPWRDMVMSDGREVEGCVFIPTTEDKIGYLLQSVPRDILDFAIGEEFGHLLGPRQGGTIISDSESAACIDAATASEDRQPEEGELDAAALEAGEQDALDAADVGDSGYQPPPRSPAAQGHVPAAPLPDADLAPVEAPQMSAHQQEVLNQAIANSRSRRAARAPDAMTSNVQSPAPVAAATPVSPPEQQEATPAARRTRSKPSVGTAVAAAPPEKAPRRKPSARK